MIPLNQTTVLDPDETLDGAFEWLGGANGLVVKDGVLVGAIAPRDVGELVPPGDRGAFGADGVRGASTAPGPVSRPAG